MLKVAMGSEESAPIKDEKMQKSQKASRIHITYTDGMKERLEEIKLETDKGSVSEVVRQALLFYTLAFEEHKKGSDFLIRLKNGEIERLRMFM